MGFFYHLPDDIYSHILNYIDAYGKKNLCAVSSRNNNLINKYCPLNTRYAQICFLIDGTSSMYIAVKQITQFINSCIQQINNEQKQIHIEIALVVFWDYDRNLGKAHVINFGEPLRVALIYLSNMYVGSGGDLAEAEKTGYCEVLKLNWSPQNIKKLIFRIGDAPMHDDIIPKYWDIYGKVERYYIGEENYNINNLANKIKNKNIQIMAFCIIDTENETVANIDIFYEKHLKFSEIMCNQNKIMTNITNGKMFIITRNDAHTLCDVLSSVMNSHLLS
tara:strand:+ start:1495 stop:2325 length:831 start_codon:yes stop_codon:yes gene_type:complete